MYIVRVCVCMYGRIDELGVWPNYPELSYILCIKYIKL